LIAVQKPSNERITKKKEKPTSKDKVRKWKSYSRNVLTAIAKQSSRLAMEWCQ